MKWEWKLGEDDPVNAATFFTTILSRLVLALCGLFLLSLVLPGSYLQWLLVASGVFLLVSARVWRINFTDASPRSGRQR